MKRIKSIEEIHNILLGIIKEFHRICEANNIPYYLVYGSMLGAIRHRGFIPWDDDIDVAIEYKYYSQLLDCLQKNLSSKYRVLSRYDKRGAPGGFLKIEEIQTLLIEPYLKKEECTGVFIDIFILYPATGNVSLFSRYTIWKCLRYIQMNRFYQPQTDDFPDRAIKALIKCVFFWLKKHQLINLFEKLLVPNSGDYLSTYNTIYNKRDIIPRSYYGRPVLVEFENYKLYGVEFPHKYLSLIYNDYMKLPSAENRRVHLSDAYYINITKNNL